MSPYIPWGKKKFSGAVEISNFEKQVPKNFGTLGTFSLFFYPILFNTRQRIQLEKKTGTFGSLKGYKKAPPNSRGRPRLG